MLDDRDHAILALLQDDADVPVTDIANRVSLSISACSRRIARLRQDGYIAKSVAILDRKAGQSRPDGLRHHQDGTALDRLA